LKSFLAALARMGAEMIEEGWWRLAGGEEIAIFVCSESEETHLTLDGQPAVSIDTGTLEPYRPIFT
jgi:hypothetical protein